MHLDFFQKKLFPFTLYFIVYKELLLLIFAILLWQSIVRRY